MKVMIVHNRYRERGGEDVVAEAEAALLREGGREGGRDGGHEVIEYRRDSAELDALPAWQAAWAATSQAIWSRRTRAELGALLQRERPDVIHLHNAWPLVSPAVCAAAADAGVPLVATLHNFRHLCAQAMLLRDGAPCEDCLGGTPWPAIRHACWRGSRAQTSVLVTSTLLHRGTWARGVARWIALSDFARSKFVGAGFAAERVEVLPNFAPDPGPPPDLATREGLLFVGRLAPEKGVQLLAEVMRAAPELRLELVGDGPAAGAFDGLANVRRHGTLDAPAVAQAMRRARALVLPSQCYEMSPRVLAEALAAGLPVVASELGALPELLGSPAAGWCVPAGDVRAWVDALRRVVNDDREVALRSVRARALWQSAYTPAAHREALLAVYRRVRAGSGQTAAL